MKSLLLFLYVALTLLYFSRTLDETNTPYDPNKSEFEWIQSHAQRF